VDMGVMTMIAVVHPVDTVLVEMAIVTEAHLVVVTMTTIVVATAPLPELEALLMITHLPEVALRTLTVASMLQTHMLVAGLLMIALHQGITHQGMLRMNMMHHPAAVTG